MNNENVVVLFFHEAHESFSNTHHGWSTIRTNRHRVRPQNLMLLKKRIHFFKYLFFCVFFGKLPTNEKLFHMVIGGGGGWGRGVAVGLKFLKSLVVDLQVPCSSEFLVLFSTTL